MTANKTLWTVLLALLCVPASAVGIILGFLVGCVIAMILQGIFAPGASYDHYSVGTPVGNVAILTPVAIGTAAPWIVWVVYIRRVFRKRQRINDQAPAEQD